jgi:dihydrofolate synthase / folylpolyglutamate synthase
VTYPEAIQFLYGLRWFGLKLGLENTFKLAALAGNPQDKLHFIHVAGTNGKGSTCAMLESIYRAAGLRVGLFTSPHLVSFRERIQVNRELISEDDVVRLVDELRQLCSSGFQPESRSAGFQPAARPAAPHPGPSRDDLNPIANSRPGPGGSMPPSAAGGTPDTTGRRDACPTFFEFVTVMALRYFAERKCDLVIWETGLGGRLDATNIVTPLASVITNIQFDHQQWLGHTRVEIAAEKAGIIKPGVPVVTATDAPDALEVIGKTAREKKAPLTVVSWPEPSQPTPNPSQEGNLRPIGSNRALAVSGAVDIRFPEKIALPLLGGHQRLNAALALATVHAIQDRIRVDDEAIRVGLETVQWPGRLQLIKTPSNQTILLDGAHNGAGAEALRQALHEYFPDAELTLVLGVLQDKNWTQICETLAPLAAHVFLTSVQSDRAAAPDALRAACAKANPAAKVVACPSLADALKQSINDPFIVVTGSLYLVGEALELLGLSPTTAAGERGLNEWTLKK